MIKPGVLPQSVGEATSILRKETKKNNTYIAAPLKASSLTPWQIGHTYQLPTSGQD